MHTCRLAGTHAHMHASMRGTKVRQAAGSKQTDTTTRPDKEGVRRDRTDAKHNITNNMKPEIFKTSSRSDPKRDFLNFKKKFKKKGRYILFSVIMDS